MTAKGKVDLAVVFKIAVDKDVLCCKYSPDAKHIVAGHTEGVVRVYESRTGDLIRSLIRDDMKEEVPVTSIHFRTQSSRTDCSFMLTTYTDGKVILWDYMQGKVIKELTEKRQTLGATFHPKLQKFLTVGDNSAIYLYDEETMLREHVYEKGTISSVVDGHNSRVFAATFHPVQTTEFISGGWDSVLHVWDMRQANSQRYIKGVHMCGEGLDFSKSGRELLTCSYSRETPLQLWNYQSGKLMANIEPDPYKSMLYCGQWIYPDTLIVGGTDPNLLRVVSLKTLSTTVFYKGSSSGVYSVDHCLKRTSSTKKELTSEMKIIFSIDKSLIEADLNL